MQYHISFRLRELGQVPLLLVFLTPRQALSSHSQVFVMILWESMNFHPDNNFFKLPALGIKQLTLGLQVHRSPLHNRGLHQYFLWLQIVFS